MSIVEKKSAGEVRPVSTDTSVPQSGSQRVTVIEPRSGLATINLSEVWAFRDLLFTFAIRDVKLRYRQTALGVIWVVMQPILSALIFNIIFGMVGKGRFTYDGYPPFIFIFVGQMAWSVINSSITRTTGSLIGNANLVSKIYFPRLVLPLSNIGSVAIDFGVSFAVLLILLVLYHIPLTIWIVTLPFFLLLTTFAAIGFGLYMAALMVSYRDIAYVLPIFLQLLMYASPVNFSSTGLPEDIKKHAWALLFFQLNPVTTLVNGMRWSLLGTNPPSLISVAVMTAFAVVLFYGGAFFFRTQETRFADVI